MGERDYLPDRSEVVLVFQLEDGAEGSLAIDVLDGDYESQTREHDLLIRVVLSDEESENLDTQLDVLRYEVEALGTWEGAELKL